MPSAHGRSRDGFAHDVTLFPRDGMSMVFASGQDLLSQFPNSVSALLVLVAKLREVWQFRSSLLSINNVKSASHFRCYVRLPEKANHARRPLLMTGQSN